MTVGLYYDREHHQVATDRWGPIEYSRPYPDPDHPGELTEVGPLILVSVLVIAACLTLGAVTLYGMADTTVIFDEGRMFMTVKAKNGSWLWELHEAKWLDGHQSPALYVGVFPD